MPLKMSIYLNVVDFFAKFEIAFLCIKILKQILEGKNILVG